MYEEQTHYHVSALSQQWKMSLSPIITWRWRVCVLVCCILHSLVEDGTWPGPPTPSPSWESAWVVCVISVACWLSRSFETSSRFDADVKEKRGWLRPVKKREAGGDQFHPSATLNLQSNWPWLKMKKRTLTNNVLLGWYFQWKRIRKIGLILKTENQYWKSDFGQFWPSLLSKLNPRTFLWQFLRTLVLVIHHLSLLS